MEEAHRRRKQERREDLKREAGERFLFPLDQETLRSLPDVAAPEEAVGRLNEMLSDLGVSFRLAGNPQDPDSAYYLRIEVKRNSLEYRKKRDAGRKRMSLYYEKDGRSVPATLHGVEALMKEHGADDAARMLGISRAGLYKRLKLARLEKRPCFPGDEPLDPEDVRF